MINGNRDTPKSVLTLENGKKKGESVFMNTPPAPRPILRPVKCPTCGPSHLESGGNYIRKIRDLQGIQKVKVLRLRCAKCHKTLDRTYPQGVVRACWYTQKVQGIFAILTVHQVSESCRAEIATLLGYALTEETQNAWQDTQALRVERDHHTQCLQAQQLGCTLKVASIDEIHLDETCVYTLTDTQSQAVVSMECCTERNSLSVRSLLEKYPMETVISDGCPLIKAGLAWHPQMFHARCWFHVMQSLSKKAGRELVTRTLESGKILKHSSRQFLAWDIQFLYGCEKLEEAENFLIQLQARYGEVLAPLLEAWEGLKLRWTLPNIPLTNNASETLYKAIWGRERKRIVKAFDRGVAWMHTALYRWNHHQIRGLTPWQRLTGKPAIHWLDRFLTPLGRPLAGSTHF